MGEPLGSCKCEATDWGDQWALNKSHDFICIPLLFAELSLSLFRVFRILTTWLCTHCPCLLFWIIYIKYLNIIFPIERMIIFIVSEWDTYWKNAIEHKEEDTILLKSFLLLKIREIFQVFPRWFNIRTFIFTKGIIYFCHFSPVSSENLCIY